jgi:hypothetical protein
MMILWLSWQITILYHCVFNAQDDGFVLSFFRLRVHFICLDVINDGLNITPYNLNDYKATLNSRKQSKFFFNKYISFNMMLVL